MFNSELEKYFKEHNYSLYSTENGKNSEHVPSKGAIHEEALYNYRKLLSVDEEDGSHYYEECLIRICKNIYFNKEFGEVNTYFYYTIYAVHYSLIDSGRVTYDEVIAHNEELTVEHIEAIRNLMKIPYKDN